MNKKIITKIETKDALLLGNIEGLKTAISDIKTHITEGEERTFLIKYLTMQINNLQCKFKD